ncbi:hypothetical protein Ancab_004209 [Ancistrocladus abbreviatus]
MPEAVDADAAGELEDFISSNGDPDGSLYSIDRLPLLPDYPSDWMVILSLMEITVARSLAHYDSDASIKLLGVTVIQMEIGNGDAFR